MKILNLFIFIFACPLLLFSQTKLTGTVNDSVTQKPISRTSILLYPLGESSILSYTITDKNGIFELKFDDNTDSLTLKASSLGYKDFVKNISVNDQEINIFLAHKVESLEEVFIKNPPIKKRNNTLVYNANDFKSDKDRSIADAMRKMPGIEISSTGEIKYLGEPINKFYVNNMDMMEGKYSMISNNLNIDDVRSVEILENHQPLKVLDSVVPSDRAAINLKLKNKYTWSGHFTAGAGATPGLWYGKFSPMVFTNKFQSLVSYQTNNTGTNVKNDFTEFSISSFRYNQTTNNRKNWLGLANISSPPFSLKRWFDNESHALSANALFKNEKDYEFKVNASYINDYSKKNGGKRSTYKLPEGDLIIDNKTEQSSRDESLNAGFSIERNRNKDFIKEKFNFSKKWDRGTALIFENKNPQNQDLNTSYINIRNDFELITPLFSNQMVTFDSHVGYNESPQSLEISPGVFSEVLSSGDSISQVNQNLFHKRFYAKHSIDITKKINKFSLSMRPGIDFETQDMSSQILKNSIEKPKAKFRNNMTWRKLSGYFNLNINYKSDNLNAVLKLPFAIKRYEIIDKINEEKKAKNPFTVNPSFWTEYKFLNFWSISLNLRYHENFGPLNNIYSGYLLTDYRNLRRQNFSISKTQSKIVSFGVKYRNPISNWFAHLNLSHSSNKKNQILNSITQANGATVIESLNQTNKSNKNSVNLSISKTFSPIQTTFKLDSYYSNTKNNMLFNEELIKNTTNSWVNNLNLSSDFADWITAEYDGSISLSSIKNKIQNTQKIKQLNNKIGLYFYFLGDHTLNLSGEWMKSKLGKTSRSDLFGDIMYRFTLSEKRKIDIELSLINIFNTDTYQNLSVDNYTITESHFNLRQRQFLITLRFPL